MLLAGSPMISTKKVVDMTNSKAFGRITDVVTMNIEVVIKVLFIVAEIANHMAKTAAEMIMLIETIMI